MKKRYVALQDGPGMGDSIMIFETDAPKKRLLDLLKISISLVNAGAPEDIPIWADILEKENYIFNFIDEHANICAYGSGKEWIAKYPDITEKYIICKTV